MAVVGQGEQHILIIGSKRQMLHKEDFGYVRLGGQCQGYVTNTSLKTNATTLLQIY